MREMFERFMGYKLVRKLLFAIKFFTAKRVMDSASALTYNTMLSLVPICAVVFATARGFGYTIYIENWFRGILSSQPTAAELLISFVNSYLEHTKSGIILGIGLIFMLYTVVMLTRNVEETFNDIWHVENRKNTMRTFTDYLAIFFLIPLVIIIMSGISLFVSTMASNSQFGVVVGPLSELIVNVLPFILMWVAFTALYVFMPNTKVKFLSALGPGFLAALSMIILQWFYVNAQMFISNYNAIYGSFAALPLFMLWVQFSWTICLFGAELSYTNQNLEDFAYAEGAAHMSSNEKIIVSILLLSKICKRFDEGKPPYTAIELKDETSFPLSIIRDLLNNMSRLNVITEIVGQKSILDSRFQPALSLDKITLGYVVSLLSSNGDRIKYIDSKSLLADSEDLRKMEELYTRYISELNEYQLKELKIS